MLKKDVLRYFGAIAGMRTGAHVRVARLCGVHKAAVTNWGEIIPIEHAITIDRVFAKKTKLRDKLVAKYGPCKLRFDINLYRGNR